MKGPSLLQLTSLVLATVQSLACAGLLLPGWTFSTSCENLRSSHISDTTPNLQCLESLSYLAVPVRITVPRIASLKSADPTKRYVDHILKFNELIFYLSQYFGDSWFCNMFLMRRPRPARLTTFGVTLPGKAHQWKSTAYVKLTPGHGNILFRTLVLVLHEELDQCILFGLSALKHLGGKSLG